MRQQKTLDRKGGQCETTSRRQIAKVENATSDKGAQNMHTKVFFLNAAAAVAAVRIDVCNSKL